MTVNSRQKKKNVCVHSNVSICCIKSEFERHEYSLRARICSIYTHHTCCQCCIFCEDVCVLECLPDVCLLLERKRRGVRHSRKCARLECFFSVKSVVLARIHQALIFADISRMFADVGVLQGHPGETTVGRSG